MSSWAQSGKHLACRFGDAKLFVEVVLSCFVASNLANTMILFKLCIVVAAIELTSWWEQFGKQQACRCFSKLRFFVVQIVHKTLKFRSQGSNFSKFKKMTMAIKKARNMTKRHVLLLVMFRKHYVLWLMGDKYSVMVTFLLFDTQPGPSGNHGALRNARSPPKF